MRVLDLSIAGTPAEPLWQLCYRYWFWGWLFCDVNQGDLLRRTAAWRHNLGQRMHLPVYMRRWLALLALTFAVAVPLMILTWRYVVAPATNIELLNGWFQNEWASVWKPLAQVTAIAVLQLTLAPFAALAVPALAVAGGSRLETVQWMKHRLHHKTYDALALGYWGMTLGVLAFVPWVGLLALPVMCLLLVRVFHLTFARREEWPSRDESGA